MRHTIRIWLAALAVVAAVTGSAVAGERSLTVVELYTSQGCSSCPPADELLGNLAKRKDLLALSFHVDYWDYIGWKDPYASPAHTQRQRHYAQTLGRPYVYTPQMVIHGITDTTGSDRSAVLRRIDQAEDLGSIPLDFTHDASGGMVTVSIPEIVSLEELAVWFVVYDREHTTDVKRGENAGRTITNFNVVRGLKKIAMWKGDAISVDVAPKDVAASGDGCAVIVQSPRTGRVFAAKALTLDQPH